MHLLTDFLFLVSSGVKPYNFKMNCTSGKPFLFHSLVAKYSPLSFQMAGTSRSRGLGEVEEGRLFIPFLFHALVTFKIIHLW